MAVRAACGFRIKSGWATAVLLGGDAERPQLLDRRVVDLTDPDHPELRQPHHASMGRALVDEMVLAERRQAIEAYGRRSLSLLINHYKDRGYALVGAGLVVGSDAAPETIANQHIRAHAHEGRLFRHVVEGAMRGEGLACSIWTERRLYGVAQASLGRAEADIKKAVTELGRGTCGGWRVDEKAATIAAWIVVSSCPAA